MRTFTKCDTKDLHNVDKEMRTKTFTDCRQEH